MLFEGFLGGVSDEVLGGAYTKWVSISVRFRDEGNMNQPVCIVLN